MKKDLKETYFSDQFSLFKNKLLIYFRKNKLIEGLHSEISVPIETKNTLFNFGLYPGGTLPTFNFSFQLKLTIFGIFSLLA